MLGWPGLLVRALDDLHDLARAARRLDDVAAISQDLRELNRQLVRVERRLADIARPARTTDTIMRAMPGSKAVAARAKAQRDRGRAAKPAPDDAPGAPDA